MTPRAEALELLARLVDEQEKPKGGRGKTRPESGQVLPKQRVAEGRLIARTGAVAKVEAALAEHDGDADRRHLTREQQREIARFLRGQGHSLRAIAKATDMDKQTVARDVTGVSPETPADLVAGLDGKRYPSRRPTVVAAKNGREAERA